MNPTKTSSPETQSRFPAALVIRDHQLAFAVAIGAVLLLLFYPGVRQPYVEGVDYARMAAGDYHQIYFYYAGRILHPWVSGILSRALDVSIGQAFLDVAIGSLLFVSACVGYFGKRLGAPRGGLLSLLLLISPAFVLLYTNYYFQDVFHAALVALLLVALISQSWLAIPVVFLLHLTRESSMLLTGCLAALTFWRGKRLFSVAVVLAAVAAVIITSSVVHAAIPNKHGVGVLGMYLLKVPYDFLFNVTGLVFWSDTNSQTLACEPVWRMAPPIHLGTIKEVGFCGFQVINPIRTVAAFAGSFGVAPALLLAVFSDKSRRRRLLTKDASLAEQVAIGYGLLCALFTPLVGTWPNRYILYCWPLFWCAVPSLFRDVAISTRTWVSIGACHMAVAVCWLILWPIDKVAPGGLLLAISLFCNYLAFRVAKPCLASHDPDSQRPKKIEDFPL